MYVYEQWGQRDTTYGDTETFEKCADCLNESPDLAEDNDWLCEGCHHEKHGKRCHICDDLLDEERGANEGDHDGSRHLECITLVS